MGPGEKLRQERKKQGISLAEIEEETKIMKVYLEAIENENFTLLPQKIYTLGFVKQYAKLLGLSYHDIVDEYRRAAYGHSEEVETTMTKSITNMPGVFIMVVASLGLIIIFTGLFLLL